MRKLTALVAGVTLAMAALPAAAGVVITQKQHVSSGPKVQDFEQTISVQGNKQKMVMESRTIITDLDKGMMYVLDPKTKTYFQIEFPPKRASVAEMVASRTNAAMNFKKSGTTREVAGFKCTDYDGGGRIMTGDYTVKECFSTRAPGAEEYAAFEKNMADKLKGSSSVNIGEVPDGVPLALDSSMKMGKINFPGMKPEQAAQLNSTLAKRPPVLTSTVVEKIETKKLTESDFEVPSDFTKRDLPAPGSMKMAPMKLAPPAGAPAAGASPAAH